MQCSVLQINSKCFRQVLGSWLCGLFSRVDFHRKGQFHRHGGKEEIKSDVADDRRRQIVMRWRSVFLFHYEGGGGLDSVRLTPGRELGKDLEWVPTKWTCERHCQIVVCE